jgi:hypothetical protein
MHQSSMDKMLNFKNTYLKDRESETLNILDIGSQDINGSYKQIFDLPKWKYSGADMQGGNNVNIVLKNPYKWQEIQSNSIDVLISGQAFEHIEFFWITALEVTRVLKPDGLCCIIAPSSGQEHRYPVDCWRFYPDGFSALARFAQLEVVEVFTQWESLNYSDGSDRWQDSVLVARKPNLSYKRMLQNKIKHWLLYTLADIK